MDYLDEIRQHGNAVDESVELVKVHEGGAVELVMKYGDIYELTIQSIKEVQEAM